MEEGLDSFQQMLLEYLDIYIQKMNLIQFLHLSHKLTVLPYNPEIEQLCIYSNKLKT